MATHHRMESRRCTSPGRGLPVLQWTLGSGHARVVRSDPEDSESDAVAAVRNEGKTTTLVSQDADPLQVVAALELPVGSPVLVVLGGAGGMSPSDYQACKPLFESSLAPIADRSHSVVVDGGTDAGVMRLMGRARASTRSSFPLVGVVPTGSVASSADEEDPSKAALEPNHSHVALVPGRHFGDESTWLAQLASAVANGRPFPALLVNGGMLSLRDATNVVRAGGDVIAVEGTGRAADRLARGAGGGTPEADCVELLASGHVTVHSLRSPRWDEALGAALLGRRDAW